MKTFKKLCTLILSVFLVGFSAFNSAKAMITIKEGTVTTYFFEQSETSKYTSQIVEGNLVIKKGAKVTENTFAFTTIKGNVLIKEGAHLDRWAFKSAKIEGNVTLESDVNVGFQAFISNIIKGNVIMHNIHPQGAAFEQVEIIGNIVIKKDMRINYRPLFSYAIIDGEIIVEKGAEIHPKAFVNSGSVDIRIQ